ncbi:Uncharacterised protein [uncultured archaeon]|nr:Uncharacterised protein [uncultured archaeon]
MVLKQKANDVYQGIIQDIFGNLDRFSLSGYVSRAVEEKTPWYAGRFFKPEKKYLASCASELDPYVSELLSQARDTLSDPERARNTTLDSLIRFPDPVKQEEFCKTLHRTVEDVSYAAEIAATKGYELWEEYSEKPIIGYFMRRALKKKIGMTELPDFGIVKGLIASESNEARELLKQYDPGFSSNEESHEEVQKRYHHRMGRISDSRRLLAYDYEHPEFKPPLKSGNSSDLENRCRNSERPGIFGNGCLMTFLGFTTWIGIMLGVGFALL